VTDPKAQPHDWTEQHDGLWTRVLPDGRELVARKQHGGPEWEALVFLGVDSRRFLHRSYGWASVESAKRAAEQDAGVSPPAATPPLDARVQRLVEASRRVSDDAEHYRVSTYRHGFGAEQYEVTDCPVCELRAALDALADVG
jgi:hypothetical protein